MTPVPLLPEGVSLPLALSIGLLYGLGPCLVSCLPTLAPVFLNSDGGIRQAWRILLPLSAGRLTVYGSFGALSGWWGGRFVAGVAPAAVGLASGLAMVLIGLALLLRPKAGCGRASGAPCSPPPGGAAPVVVHRGNRSPPPGSAERPVLTGGLYLMGVGMALSPCVPLSAVLVAAAARGSPVEGALLGLGFGAGALVAPSLAYGIGLAYFGQQLRQQLKACLPRLEGLSALLFIVIGSRQALSGLL